MGNSISEVSVFVDESGSFDSQRSPSRYYLVTLVFHDQSKSVENEIVDLENALERLGLPRDHCVHAGPLVRREQAYSNMTREERRRVFSAMMALKRRSPCLRHGLNLLSLSVLRDIGFFRSRTCSARLNLCK